MFFDRIFWYACEDEFNIFVCIALIHNGTIDNCEVLKTRLIHEGITFRSETDTEVIANLIGYYLDKGYNEEDAFLLALKELDGSWGLCMISKNDPGRIY